MEAVKEFALVSMVVLAALGVLVLVLCLIALVISGTIDALRGQGRGRGKRIFTSSKEPK